MSAVSRALSLHASLAPWIQRRELTAAKKNKFLCQTAIPPDPCADARWIGSGDCMCCIATAESSTGSGIHHHRGMEAEDGSRCDADSGARNDVQHKRAGR